MTSVTALQSAKAGKRKVKEKTTEQKSFGGFGRGTRT